MFKHKNFKEMFSAYLDGELTPQEQQAAIEHLEQCASCRKEFNALQRLERSLKSWKDQDLSLDLEQMIERNYLPKKNKKEVAKMKSPKKLFVGVTSGALAILLAFGIVLHMQTYSKRGLQGRVRDARQQALFQYQPEDIGLTIESGYNVWPPVFSSEREEFFRSIGSPAAEKTFLTQSLSEPGSDLRQEDFNTESYDRIYENRFLEAIDNPLSTFSIDVDTASYANMRRFINAQQLPPPDAVRIEEMINYFNYDYPQPEADLPFSITTEIASCPWNAKHDILLIGLQGRSIPVKKLPPSNLVFLLDVSGSMNKPNKLPLLKKAFMMLAQELQSQDRVAIVVYAGAAGVVLDSTSGANKEKIIEALGWLEAGGSTAGGAGIRLAYKIARDNFIKGGNNRVILATDGDFNVGVSSDSEMVRLVEQERDKGIFLTALGFGTGNYKDAKLEKIADKGNGNYYYIDTLREARKVFVDELKTTLFTIAKDVKIQIEFNPANIKAYRLIGYENRVLAKEDFKDDSKDAGELGAGHSVTALYEIVYSGSQEVFSNVDPLEYQKVTIKGSSDLLTIKLRYKDPDVSESKLITRKVSRAARTEHPSHNFQFATAVAEYGLLLRNSEHKAAASFDAVIKRARQAKGDDFFGYRAEFIQLVETAQLLSALPGKPR